MDDGGWPSGVPYHRGMSVLQVDVVLQSSLLLLSLRRIFTCRVYGLYMYMQFSLGKYTGAFGFLSCAQLAHSCCVHSCWLGARVHTPVICQAGVRSVPSKE